MTRALSWGLVRGVVGLGFGGRVEWRLRSEGMETLECNGAILLGFKSIETLSSEAEDFSTSENVSFFKIYILGAAWFRA